MRHGRKNTNVDNHAYKFRLYPNSKQTVLINKTIGCSRLIYNSLLVDNEQYYKETGLLLKKEVSEYKKDKPFLCEADSLALANSKQNLETAYKNFFTGKSKKPVFHKKGKNDTYTTNNVNGNIEIVCAQIRLPKLGYVKIKQHRVVGKDEIIKNVTVSKVAGKYYVSVITETEHKDVDKVVVDDENKVLGIDYSVPHFYTDSNGNTTDYPKYYRRAEQKLSSEQRKLSRKVYKSNNYYKQLMKVQKLSNHIANQRKDFLHKLSRTLVNNYDAVCFEDIDLNEMKQRYKFGKSVSDAGFGMFRDMVKYKMEREGKYFIKVGKWFPSTKTCSCCGYKNEGIKLKDREWTCPQCGKHHDRDKNAAINIKKEGYHILLQMQTV